MIPQDLSLISTGFLKWTYKQSKSFKPEKHDTHRHKSQQRPFHCLTPASGLTDTESPPWPSVRVRTSVLPHGPRCPVKMAQINSLLPQLCKFLSFSHPSIKCWFFLVSIVKCVPGWGHLLPRFTCHRSLTPRVSGADNGWFCWALGHCTLFLIL